MKTTKILLALGLSAAALATVNAANYNDAGCGLGSMVFQGNSKGEQILAATTNGIGSQTTAISSETSDCRERGVARKDREREIFVAVNYRSLASELAAGQGEFATAFAGLMGCSGDSVPAFLSLAKDRYETIYPNAAVEAKEVVSTVSREMATPGVCTL